MKTFFLLMVLVAVPCLGQSAIPLELIELRADIEKAAEENGSDFGHRQGVFAYEQLIKEGKWKELPKEDLKWLIEHEKAQNPGDFSEQIAGIANGVDSFFKIRALKPDAQIDAGDIAWLKKNAKKRHHLKDHAGQWAYITINIQAAREMAAITKPVGMSHDEFSGVFRQVVKDLPDSWLRQKLSFTAALSNWETVAEIQKIMKDDQLFQKRLAKIKMEAPFEYAVQRSEILAYLKARESNNGEEPTEQQIRHQRIELGLKEIKFLIEVREKLNVPTNRKAED